MPKVPVTAKRAITVLSTEPLVPKAMQAVTQARRRSLRIQNNNSTASSATVEAPATSPQPATKQLVPGILNETESQEAIEGSGRGKKRKSVKPAADGEEQGVLPEAALEPPTKSKKRLRMVKSEVADLAPPRAEVKLEDKDIAEAANTKQKKNRRGPVGFAVRGDDIDCSAASKRARIKAALVADENGGGSSPTVLEDDVTRMCKELGKDSLALTAPWTRVGQEVGGSAWWVGVHVSTAGGMERAVINAAATGCRAFAMDTRCKMRWESPPLTDETVAAFKSACKKFGFGADQILPHGSYLINLASPDPEMAKKGYNGFLTELQRCERLGLKMYNFHPGSTTGLCSHEESMDRIAGFINDALAATKGVTVVLENMASVGNIVGGRLWHLRYIIDRVEDKSRVGFCIDTCHLFSAGVDLRTDAACKAAFEEIDREVGLKYLKGMHINDSKTPFESHRDRHENIGRGSIPLSAFRWIMNNPAFTGIPLIMETPVQEREPPVNYKKSLEAGELVWRDPTGPYGVGTDRRDVILLNSLVGA